MVPAQHYFLSSMKWNFYAAHLDLQLKVNMIPFEGCVQNIQENIFKILDLELSEKHETLISVFVSCDIVCVRTGYNIAYNKAKQLYTNDIVFSFN